tara:strand:+ start:69079 stop:69222 length:144 start_codon:yes stop_codon:yes gene_type:complete
MVEFIEHILQFGDLNQQQIGLILKKGQVVQLQKDDYFWEVGKKINYG